MKPQAPPWFVINKNNLGQWFRGSSSSNKFKNLTSENEQQHSNSSTETPAQQQRHSNSERHSNSSTAAATQQQRSTQQQHSNSSTATATAKCQVKDQDVTMERNRTTPSTLLLSSLKKKMPWNCKCYLILIGPSKKLLLKL